MILAIIFFMFAIGCGIIAATMIKKEQESKASIETKIDSENKMQQEYGDNIVRLPVQYLKWYLSINVVDDEHYKILADIVKNAEKAYVSYIDVRKGMLKYCFPKELMAMSYLPNEEKVEALKSAYDSVLIKLLSIFPNESQAVAKSFFLVNDYNYLLTNKTGSKTKHYLSRVGSYAILFSSEELINIKRVARSILNNIQDLATQLEKSDPDDLRIEKSAVGAISEIAQAYFWLDKASMDSFRIIEKVFSVDKILYYEIVEESSTTAKSTSSGGSSPSLIGTAVNTVIGGTAYATAKAISQSSNKTTKTVFDTKVNKTAHIYFEYGFSIAQLDVSNAYVDTLNRMFPEKRR